MPLEDKIKEYISTQTDRVEEVVSLLNLEELELKQDGELKKASIDKINAVIEGLMPLEDKVKVELLCNHGGITGVAELPKKEAESLISIGWAKVI